MCMIELSDGDWVTFEDQHPRARKEHHCGECGRRIDPGEVYRRWSGIDSDGFSHGKMCAHCEVATTWLVQVCSGYLFSGVLEDLEEHWREETILRSLWLGRTILSMRRRWRRPDGTLRPLPEPYTKALPSAA